MAQTVIRRPSMTGRRFSLPWKSVHGHGNQTLSLLRQLNLTIRERHGVGEERGIVALLGHEVALGKDVKRLA